MTHRILIVEDEPSIAELIAINLSHAGYEVQKALQTDVAANMMRDELPNLLILDWMLPGKSGVQFARELRANERTRSLPILMLTAKSEENDKVLGLDSGADDYVTKPFSPKELVARVKALLRRQIPLEGDGPLAVGPLKLDPVSHRVSATWPNCEPQTLSLGPTEFRLLQFMMANSERVHSRENLLDKVWGNEVYIEERTVDVHIKRLRAALSPADCDRFVETVRGSGYRITKTPTQT
ncbi:MAG: phosphate regulon transcriptional regulatory protein PhoB [Polynucleobacter sp. 24-46-87]|uniref:phosphate regulon transcriptional regulator PhoB n=1 Tax=unclassified Polynucleobacter TaxID=2640945 RepID=UPI000BD97F9F|nr:MULTISPECIES: phosphate regulon transcriptional regulator PhoB [unclassified Polynucleobacter]OYY14318.1 MAG: phosphate regulon transcriptional regulatory protein PhoB [Polynucleobacter sp. 35-46-11]OZA12668.1 MAG: phosphate regulon transcriptional regulatory protein PhoB [Polynucleobacter sp. 24-46-87]OZA75451.1 MAG: phosphate regulon transcriptional regulatory protein PhoB [Polynucleobacter sp. 39-46-10]